MAEGKTKSDAVKKPALSSRLMQMKFMQRGKEKTILKEAVAEQVHKLSASNSPDPPSRCAALLCALFCWVSCMA